MFIASLRPVVLDLWVTTPRESPDDLLGVGWDLQKFVNTVVSVWIYWVHYQRWSFILLQYQLL